ncbi:ATP-binding protein [Chlorobium phaeobacteroides]|uniref:histidine kinase n=1 Tax=Chlorobium phaeobacteroides (strain DSM 266 / SMG 266 / 2430) TaxID=290317 RepID=A1BEV2_CHLPD|nr:ATP-binding protein [Chlorobium phaeobacteroides]ABL64929.1 multi-sensor signal transduction histidine kinase [Chlorobium phaeobacteroides DSM 266]
MNAKVSVRLGIVFGLIVFLSIALSYLLQGKLINELLLKNIRQELYKELRLSRQVIDSRSPIWLVSEEPDHWTDNVGRVLDVRVTLIGKDGRVAGDSYLSLSALAKVRNHLHRPEVKEALSTGYGEDIRYSETVREQMLYMAVPVGGEAPYAVLRFAKPLYDIGELESEARKGLEGGLLWALLFSLLIGGLTALLLARPLRRIVDAAEKCVHGDYSGTIAVNRDDEIGKMARAFNFMSAEINTMQRKEEWYRAVLSGIREAIIVTNADGEIILVNPAASRMFRIDGAMLKSHPVKQLADQKLRELFSDVHTKRTTLQKEEVSLVTVKGKRTMQISSMPVKRDGQFDGTVFVLNDITKLRNLERIRRDFVSSVSHELRTPLTSIKGYTETLLDGAMHDPEHAAAFLRIILQESEQLTALVNDVLDLSRIESGKIDYRFAPTDLRSILQKSSELVLPAIEKKKIKLDMQFQEELPLVYADAAYLEIAVRNLLDNAVKYVEDTVGRIRVTAYKSESNVILEVHDNGLGIHPSDLDRIFERFYRADKARSRQSGGTGLGLAIVKHIVLAHKGTIEVHSRLNQGSVFRMSLPVSTV